MLCICKNILKDAQWNVVQAITPPCAKDIFNNKQLKTYGKSFLKFAASLVLFDAFQSENICDLIEMKTKLVGNRNLFYVGNNLNIGSYLLVSKLIIYFPYKYLCKFLKQYIIIR